MDASTSVAAASTNGHPRYLSFQGFIAMMQPQKRGLNSREISFSALLQGLLLTSIG